MDAGNLEATFEKNKVPILAAAGAGVVGLAFLSKKKAGKAAGDPAPVSTTSQGGQLAGATGGAAYDSSASDLYGAIQPQLESLGGQLTDLSNRLNGQYSTPTPVPAATPNPTTGGGSTGGTGVPTPIFVPPSNVGGMGTQYDSLTNGAPTGALAGGTWAANANGGISYFEPATPNGSFTTSTGSVVTTHAPQQAEQAQWSLGSDGLQHNQWGMTAKWIDQYGSPRN